MYNILLHLVPGYPWAWGVASYILSPGRADESPARSTRRHLRTIRYPRIAQRTFADIYFPLSSNRAKKRCRVTRILAFSAGLTGYALLTCISVASYTLTQQYKHPLTNPNGSHEDPGRLLRLGAPGHGPGHRVRPNAACGLVLWSQAGAPTRREKNRSSLTPPLCPISPLFNAGPTSMMMLLAQSWWLRRVVP